MGFDGRALRQRRVAVRPARAHAGGARAAARDRDERGARWMRWLGWEERQEARRQAASTTSSRRRYAVVTMSTVDLRTRRRDRRPARRTISARPTCCRRRDDRRGACAPAPVRPARRDARCSGLAVLPGVIDAHVHLGQDITVPRTPDEARPETEAAAAGGVCTLIAYLMSADPYDEVLAVAVARDGEPTG